MQRGITPIARAALAVCVLACGALTLASPAAATTVLIGPPTLGNEGSYTGCDDGPSACNTTLSQFGQPTPGVLLSAPADGTIVSWGVHGVTAGNGRLKLRVLRPTANGSFSGAGSSTGVIASQGDGSPQRPVTIPIARGDYIGVDVNSPTGGAGNTELVYLSLDSPATVASWTGGLADGSTADPDIQDDSIRLQLNATIELARPAIASVSPASGLPAGGEHITIAGEHLADATQVRFGTEAATIRSTTNSEVKVTAPPHPVGEVDVTVTTAAGDSEAGSTTSYDYADAAAPVPPADTIAPQLSGLTLEPSTFAAAASGPAIVPAAVVGTRVGYDLSEPATTTFHVQRKARGHRKGKRCRPGRRKHAKPCTRWVRRKGSVVHLGAAGTNAFQFSGRVGGHALKRGRYRLTGVAVDAAGNRSKPARRSFRVAQM
jgi:hypothetical protein